MEKALWNGQLYTAIEVSKSYELEKAIRQASGRKELHCPDSYCSDPILRYCHGEKKSAYFAHLNNCNCDYAKFDKETPEFMRQVKLELFDNLKNKGFNVELDVKITPHDYTHLLLTLPNGKKIAIEIGNQKTTANRIKYLSEQCANVGLELKWLIVSNDNTPVKENEAFFLKRYLLNENKHKDALIVNEEGTAVTQYIFDPNEYLINGCKIHSDNYPEFYLETSDLSRLTVQDGELTIEGFYERYDNWLSTKKRAFDKRVEEGKENLRKALERENEKREKSPEENPQKPKERREKEASEKDLITKNSLYCKLHDENWKKETLSGSQSTMPFEKRVQNFMPIWNQQLKVAKGIKFVCCERCGKVDTESGFPAIWKYKYREYTLGICKECARNK